MYIEESIIEEIKQRTDIIDIISPIVNLKTAGKNLKGLCPFHQEKTPSFIVNRIKQNFHCFGCNVGGDVYTFVMKYEGLNFVDTIKKLGQMVGIEIQETSHHDPNAQKRKDLYNITEEACNWFHQNLVNKEYLLKRGINENTITQFKLGFASNYWTSLCDYLLKKGYSSELIIESGLGIFSEKKKAIFDRFRNRIIFPIYNSQGYVVGFSGRILETNDTPKDIAKYLNSPESMIFKKNQLLYGMHHAKTFISKKDSVILTEGHLDVLALQQAGFEEAIGVQGTAFTEDHAKMISRLTKNVKIIFDPDKAGINAALRILPISLAFALNTQISILPHGEDPASFLLKYPKEELEKYLNNSISLFEFKIKHLMQGKSLSPNLKVQIVNELLEDILKVRNPVLIDSLIQLLATKVQISDVKVIHSELDKKRNRFKPTKNLNNKNHVLSINNVLSPSEKELIRILLSNTEAHDKIFEKIEFDWFLHKEAKIIVDIIFKLFCEKLFTIEKVKSNFTSKPDYLDFINWASQIDYGENLNQAIEETLEKLEQNFYDFKIKQLNKMLKDKSLKKEDIKELLKTIDKFRKKLKK